MPTIPNPTPGTDPAPDPMPEDPTPTEPTIPPVVRPKPTLILDRLMKRSKAEIEFEDKTMHSALLISNFQDHSREQYPELAMFKTWCPGNYSRRYTDKAAAAALSSGSGYFGYPVEGVFGSAGWWSTNFVDRTTDVGTATKWEGQYFSKNHCLGSASQITCSVTLDGPDVYLKWGTQWAVVTKNALYDKLGADGKYYPEGGRVPRKENGDVDVDLLELLIMQEAPTYGAFVIVDFYNDYYHFAAMDGAHEQYTKLDEPTRPPRDMPFEESALPMTSELSFLPAFTPGPVTVASSFNFSMKTGTTGMDYTRPWLKAFEGYDQQGWVLGPPGSGQSTLAAAQTNSTTMVMAIMDNANGPIYCPIVSVTSFAPLVKRNWYSGWLRPGHSAQLVGWVLKTPSGAAMVATSYGFTSLSPTANRVGYGEKYRLTSTNTQAEIMSMIYVGGQIAAMGFAYDASIGEYGEVTWLSMI